MVETKPFGILKRIGGLLNLSLGESVLHMLTRPKMLPTVPAQLLGKGGWIGV